MIAYIATFIVGLVFLVTGIIKALSSRKFIEHIFQYQIFPPQLAKLIAVSFIGIECALGSALILHEFPEWTVPGTAILLGLLSIITFWSTSTGRTEDCGCYGGLAIVTPAQSILLNLGYILLLGLAFYYPVANYHTAAWQWLVSLVFLVFGSILAQQSQQNPLVDLSYLKAGKKWQKSWLNDSSLNLEQGTYFLVFLGAECPYCKQWVPLLNIMNANSTLPNVRGIMTLDESGIETFKAKHLVHFPVVTMNKILFNYMIEGVPTAVLVKDGKIATISMGQIPQEYYKKIQDFYQATVKRETPQKPVRFAG